MIIVYVHILKYSEVQNSGVRQNTTVLYLIYNADDTFRPLWAVFMSEKCIQRKPIQSMNIVQVHILNYSKVQNSGVRQNTTVLYPIYYLDDDMFRPLWAFFRSQKCIQKKTVQSKIIVLVHILNYSKVKIVGYIKTQLCCILFIMLTTTCFGHCGPSSGHKNVYRGKLYRV